MKNILYLLLFINFFIPNKTFAQNKQQIIDLPSNISIQKIGNSWLIARDSIGKLGLLSPYGKWILKPKYDRLEGPIAGVFFGINNYETNIQSSQSSDKSEFYSPVLYPKESKTRGLTILTRIDTLGNVMDTFELQDWRIRVCPSGIFCKLNFPNSKLYFIPAYGKAIEWNGYQDFVDLENNITGLQNDITLFIKTIPAGNPIFESRKNNYNYSNDHKSYDSLMGFIVKPFYQEIIPNQLMVIDKKDNSKYWVGEEINFKQAEKGNPANLIFGNASGIYQVFSGEIIKIKGNVFKKYVKTNTGSLTVLAKKENGVWETDLMKSVSSSILPQFTKFLFSYPQSPCIQTGSYCELDTNLLIGDFQERIRNFIMSRYRNTAYRNSGLSEGTLRPQIVFEDKGKLFAIDPQGNIFQCPVNIKDTVEFLAYLRFVPKAVTFYALESTTYELFWSDPLDSYKGMEPVMLDTLNALINRINLSNQQDAIPSYSKDFVEMTAFLRSNDSTGQSYSMLSQPKVYLVQSALIEEKYREIKGEFSRLFLYQKALYSYKGNKIAGLKNIEEILAVDAFNCYFQTSDTDGVYLQNGYGKFLFKANKGHFRTDDGFLAFYNGDGKSFALIKKGEGFKTGINFRDIQKQESGILEANVRHGFYKGMSVNYPHRIYNDVDCLFLIDFNSDKSENSKDNKKYYNLLMNYNGGEVINGPISLTESKDRKIKIEWPGGYKIFPEEKTYLAIDSFVTPGFQRALILRDKIGYYFKTKEGFQRINHPERVFISFDKKKVFFVVDSSDGSRSAYSLDNFGTILNTGIYIYLSSNLKHGKEFDFERYPIAPKYCLAQRSNTSNYTAAAKELSFFNSETEKILTFKEDTKYKDCYFIPDTILGVIGGGYLVNYSSEADIIKIYLDKFRSLYQNHYFLVINPQTLKSIYLRKNDISGNNDLLFSNSFLVNYNLEIIKDKGDPIVFLESKFKFSRNKTSIYEVTYFDSYNNIDTLNGKYLDNINSPSNATIIRDNILVTKDSEGYKLFQESKLINTFKSLKIPLTNYQSDEKIFLGKDNRNVTRVFHLTRSDFYEEEKPDAILSSFYEKLPDFKTGLLDCNSSVQFLLTFSNLNNAPIGLLENGSWNSHDCKNLVDSLVFKAFGKNYLLFNPLNLPKDLVIKRIKEIQNMSVKNVQLTGITKQGLVISKSVQIPEGYYFTQNANDGTNMPGIRKIKNNQYDFFIPCDSDIYAEYNTKKEFLFSTEQSIIFPLEHLGSLVNLLQTPSLLESDWFPKNFDGSKYYLFNGKIPVTLKDILGDVASVKPSDGNLIVELYSWSGFIDKNGNQKFSLSCEGGSCSSNKVHFKSGRAAIKSSEGIIHFIDTTGQEAFSQKFQCTSDFFQGWAIGRPAVDNIYYNNEIIIINRYGKAIIIECMDARIHDIYLDFELKSFFGSGFLKDGRPVVLIFDTLGQLKNKIEGYDSFFTKSFGSADNVRIVSEGLFRVKKKLNYSSDPIGFADLNGNVIIEARYDEAGCFSGSMAAARISDSKFYIDKRGKEFFKENKFSEIRSFSEGRAFVSDTAGWHIIDSAGKKLGNEKVRYLSDFNEGLARVNTYDSEKMGFINSDGKWAIQPIYKESSDFSEGLAFVTDTTDDSYFIDMMGNRKKDFPKIWKASEFSEGLCHVIKPSSKVSLDISSGKSTPYEDLVYKNQLRTYENQGYTVQFTNEQFGVLEKTEYGTYKLTKKILIFAK